MCLDKIEVYHGARGPIRRLPVEILAEIFVSCLDSNIDRSMNPWRAPLKLCRICRFWTEVALATSRLWYRLGIEFQHSREARGLINIVEAWLQRTKAPSLELSISLSESHWQDNWFEPARSIPHGIMDIVIPHLPRCRRLALRVPYPLANSLFHIPAGSVESLEELYVELSAGQPSSKQMTAFSIAPRLSRLNMHMWGGFSYANLHFPWSQLTKLVLQRVITSPTAPHILAPCSSLEECTLEIEGWNDSNQVIPVGTANLPHLRTLSVGFRGSGLISQFFRPLILSQLTWFHILFHEIAPQGHWPQSEIMALLSRSCPPLQILELFWDNVTIEELVQVLRAVPSLLKLRVAIPELITPELFEMLSYSETSNLLPRLQALDMTTDFVGFPLNPHETIVPLIKSRWWSDDRQPIAPNVTRLMRVGINERDDNLLRDFIAPLESFRKEGLRVTGEFSYEDEGTVCERYDVDKHYI